MKDQSGSKRKSLDREIALAFMKTDSDEAFYQALERVSSELTDQTDTPFADVPYDQIFDDKILDTLRSNSDIQAAIRHYIVRYNELLDSSIYFTKGVFEYYNANQIARALANNGFLMPSTLLR